jgi:uncharacterized protein
MPIDTNRGALGRAWLTKEMTDTGTEPTLQSGPPADALAAMLAEVRALNAADGETSEGRRMPPVELWNPPDCGDIGMEIRADGSWWHAGTRIGRQPLIDLFATVLRKDEDGRTWLVTPGEKVIVHVADAHFRGIRVDLHRPGPDQVITLGPANPLRVSINPQTREPRPYVRVRGRLEALLTRAAFYELVGWGEERDGVFGVASQGLFFPVDTPE